MLFSSRKEILETIHLIGVKIILLYLFMWILMFAFFLYKGDLILVLFLVVNLILFIAALVIHNPRLGGVKW